MQHLLVTVACRASTEQVEHRNTGIRTDAGTGEGAAGSEVTTQLGEQRYLELDMGGGDQTMSQQGSSILVIRSWFWTPAASASSSRTKMLI